MARRLREDIEAPFPVYEDDPMPPWYTRLYEQTFGRPPTGERPGPLTEGPTVSDVDPARLGQGRTLESYRAQVPAAYTGGQVGPESREAVTLDLELGRRQGEEQARFWGELLAGLAVSGAIPAAAVPSAMTLLSSSPLGALWRNLAPQMARRIAIAAAPAAVDVATGAPEQAPATFGWSLGGEFVGTGAKGVPPLAGRIVETVPSPEGRIATEVLEGLGKPVTMGTRASGPYVAEFQEALRTSPLGGPIRRQLRKGEQAVQRELSSLEDLGVTGEMRPQAPHALVRYFLEQRRRDLARAEVASYGAVDEVLSRAGGTAPAVDAQPVKQLGQALQAELEGVAQPLAAQRLALALSRADRLSFAEMQALRADLHTVLSQVQEIRPEIAARYRKELEPLVDAQMSRAVRPHGKEAHQAWTAAQKGHQDNARLFQTPAVERLLSAEADKVFGEAARAGEPYSIRSAREAVGNPRVWYRVQQAWLEQALSRFSDPLTGTVQGPELLKYLKDTFGEAALGELFPSGHGQRLVDLATTMAVLQRRGSQEGMARRVIRWTPTAGLVFPAMEFYHWARPEGETPPSWSRALLGGAVALSPAVLARAMANPELSRWLAEGMKVSPSVGRRMEVGGMLLSLLAREGLLPEEEGAAVGVVDAEAPPP